MVDEKINEFQLHVYILFFSKSFNEMPPCTNLSIFYFFGCGNNLFHVFSHNVYLFLVEIFTYHHPFIIVVLVNHGPFNMRNYVVLRFTLLKEHLVEFNKLAAAHAEGADDMVNRVMQRDNIGIMALLETVDPVEELNNVKKNLAVTNVHIHWDPQFRDVKVIQTVMLLRELKIFLEEAGGLFTFINIFLS